MGIFDKAKDALGDDPEQVEGGIDKAADFADDRTGAAELHATRQARYPIRPRLAPASRLTRTHPIDPDPELPPGCRNPRHPGWSNSSAPSGGQETLSS